VPKPYFIIMKTYQRILIWTHSRLEESGFLSSKYGFHLYVRSYFFYKRFFEARKLIGLLKTAFKLIGENNFIFVDIGCHIGFVSSFVLHHRSDATVISVDPDERNIDMFSRINKRNIKYSNLSILNSAVWEFNGTIPFNFEKSNTANNKFDSLGTDFVECISINTLLNDFNKEIVLIKIDVQGFELEVLNGSLEALSKNFVFLILEIDHSAIFARGSSSHDLIKKLKSLGFSAYCDSTNSKYLDGDLLELLDRQSCIDVLFVPEELSDFKNKIKM